MSLSDQEIRQAVKQGQFKIRPRLPKLNPAGVDLRIDRNLTLQPHKHTLVATLETVELSDYLLGILHLRSSLAREGLFASLALVDPGYQGQLTISLYNAGDRPVNLEQGEKFIQLSLLRLTKPAIQTYNGKYQNSQGAVTSHRQKQSYHHRMESIIQGDKD